MGRNFIAGAIKRPGALRAKAKAAGAITRAGTISTSYLEAGTHSSNPRTRKQANLAQTLGKLRRR